MKNLSEKKIIKPRIKSYYPENLTNKKFWAIHEAAFEFTQWPEEKLCEVVISSLPVEISEDRSRFYLTELGEKFDPKNYGKEFKKVFEEILYACERGGIEAKHVYLEDKIQWIISSESVVKWAIKNGIYFSENLQESIGHYLIKQSKNNPLLNKVKNKIIGQFLLIEQPINSVSALLNQPLVELFRLFGTGDKLINPTAIRGALNKLYPEPGGKGEKLRPSYNLEPIPEIKQWDKKRKIFRYHFPALKTALKTIMLIWFYRKGGDDHVAGIQLCIKKPFQKLLEEYFNIQLVKIYIENAPPIIEKLYLEFCAQLLKDFMEFRYE